MNILYEGALPLRATLLFVYESLSPSRALPLPSKVYAGLNAEKLFLACCGNSFFYILIAQPYGLRLDNGKYLRIHRYLWLYSRLHQDHLLLAERHVLVLSESGEIIFAVNFVNKKKFSPDSNQHMSGRHRGVARRGESPSYKMEGQDVQPLTS